MNLLTEAEILMLDILTEASEDENQDPFKSLCGFIEQLANAVDDLTRTAIKGLIPEFDTKSGSIAYKFYISHTGNTEAFSEIRNYTIFYEWLVNKIYDDADKRSRLIEEFKEWINNLADEYEARVKELDEKIKQLKKEAEELLPTKSFSDISASSEDLESKLSEYKVSEDAASRALKIFKELEKLERTIVALHLECTIRSLEKIDQLIQAAFQYDDEKFKEKFDCSKKEAEAAYKKFKVAFAELKTAYHNIKHASIFGKVKQLFAKYYKAIKGEYGVKGFAMLFAFALALYLAVWAIGRKIANLTSKHLLKPVTMFKLYFKACYARGIKGLVFLVFGLAAVIMLFGAFGSLIGLVVKYLRKKQNA